MKETETNKKKYPQYCFNVCSFVCDFWFCFWNLLTTAANYLLSFLFTPAVWLKTENNTTSNKHNPETVRAEHIHWKRKTERKYIQKKKQPKLSTYTQSKKKEYKKNQHLNFLQNKWYACTKIFGSFWGLHRKKENKKIKRRNRNRNR